MAESSPSGPGSPPTLRRAWLIATVGLTLVPFVAAVALAPRAGTAPTTALVWLLFVGSSTHVGATAWFYTVPEVRAHMREHRVRYVRVPLALVVGAAVVALVVSAQVMTWLLLAYFAWQFFHFQKQNLGVAALAARSSGAAGLSVLERQSLVAAGLGGVAALVGHPDLLRLPEHRELAVLFPLGIAVFVAAVGLGIVAVGRRPPPDRPAPFVMVYLVSLVFFLPVFLFASPYAAVAGLTIAHGLQYLLLMGLLAAAPSGRQPVLVGVLVLVNIALLLGLALNQASHLHDGHGPLRAVYGAYLGLVMAHFVIDAGIWRMRDEFPRAFLTERLPYLLAR